MSQSSTSKVEAYSDTHHVPGNQYVFVRKSQMPAGKNSSATPHVADDAGAGIRFIPERARAECAEHHTSFCDHLVHGLRMDNAEFAVYNNALCVCHKAGIVPPRMYTMNIWNQHVRCVTPLSGRRTIFALTAAKICMKNLSRQAGLRKLCITWAAYCFRR